jgi:microcystin-dependent protein
MANNIDVSAISVSSILDISKGLILANTISGSAITINVNANASSDIITINIGNSNGVKINTATNSNANDITINGVRLATTQHIRNVIPYGVIMAYYSTPAPPGWAICDGSNGTPDLRGKFILGGGIKAGGTGGIITSDNSFIYHTFLTNGTFIPTDISSVNLIVVGGGGSGASLFTTNNFGAAGGKGGTVIQESNNSVIMNQSYIVIIGSGGERSNSGSPGHQSSFGTVTALGGNRAIINQVSDGTPVNIFNSSYFMGGDGGGVYNDDLPQINGGKGGGGGSGNTANNLYMSGKGGLGGINPGGDGQTSIGGNGGPNTGGGGGGVYYNIDSGSTPGNGGSGIVIVYYPHTSIGSNGINRLTPRAIGVFGGEENVTLNINNIPSHNHNYNFSESATTGGTTAIFVGNYTNVFTNGVTASTGLGRPHNNMPPFYVLVYIMKTTDYDFCYNYIP